MMIPKITHPTGRPNFYSVESDNGVFWHSYKTCIAFKVGDTLTIRQNDWNKTTGSHLNYISEDKSIRITGSEFEQKLNEV